MWIPVVIGAAVGAVVGLVISKNKDKKVNNSSTTNTSYKPTPKQSATPEEKYDLGKAYMYYWYKKEIRVNYQKAYELLSEAAASNHVGAMVELGNLCKSGDLGKYRYVEAKGWYEKAANLGSVDGICKLGYMYHYGLGTINDKAKAKELYETAAKKGSKEAKYRLLYLK
jgi:TPR repeat protein